MSKLFISYRRDDSADVAGRLHEKLEGHFGRGSVFMDIDAMRLGLDFRKQLTDAVNQCDVLLAVIGDHWLDASDSKKGTRRLDDPEDWVRIEIAAALARPDVPVVPLLVGRQTAMPRAADLPDDLKALAYRHGTTVRSGEDFPGQVDRLIKGLEGLGKAGRIADEDPKMALRRAYEMLDLMVREVYEQMFHEPPGTRSLESLVQRLDQAGCLPARPDVAGMIQKLGETGTAQRGETFTPADVHQTLAQLTEILKWSMEVEKPVSPAAPPPPPIERETRIAVVPKGLRSFDAHDARFFLELLPGPRDEHGLPESLRFWKHRIEASADGELTVGVIYGPSGCGKSSLVKAGLLPRLADRVVSVYVETTPEETEARLLAGLRKRFPTLPGDLDLTGSIAALRPGQCLARGQHALIVLDQFEQWLHARRRDPDPELARALRQCDGEHVQAIVTVRDDFWVALTRFMTALRIEILQGHNAALVDLFDTIHARKVLTAFGKAYGHLPQDDGALTHDQDSFLTQTIDGLAQEGRVIPIRLALFADMVRGRPWTPATLKEVGGTQGIGVAFLEETFSSAALRNHQKAAQGVLKALLPESGTAIKGHMRSYDDLAAASGYAARRDELDKLLRDLDQDVRLITPTDPEGTAPEGDERPDPAGRFYQLTHDYLVPSIREWLTRKQRETRRGRAELRLADRAALWTAKPENRHLPSVIEWANIRLLTKKRDWTESQRTMMKRAGRVHGLRGLGLAIAAAVLAVVVFQVRNRIDEDKQSTLADSLVQRLLVADTTQVPDLVRALDRYRRWADPALKRVVADPARDPRAKLHASLALLPVDPSQAAYVEERLPDAGSKDLPILRAALWDFRDRVAPRLWPVLDSARPDDPRVRSVAGALASYDPQNPRWADLGDKVAQSLVTVNFIYLQDWLDNLREVSNRLKPPLAAIFRDKTRTAAVHAQATNILADYASNDPPLLASLIMDADPEAFAKLFLVATGLAEATSPVFQAELRKTAQSEDEQAKDALAERQARGAVALLRLGHADALRPLLLFKHSADPRLRSFLVNGLSPLGADPHAIVAELDRLNSLPRPVERGEGGRRPGEGSPVPTTAMDKILFHTETSQRRALILALGTYKTNGLSPEERAPLIARLLDLYENDPDAGIHGAAEWVLRQWDQPQKLREIDGRLKGQDKGQRRWFVDKQGLSFAIVEGPLEFLMGSPKEDTEQFGNETQHRQAIPHRFAIAAKEVTVEQGQPYPSLALQDAEIKQYGLTPDHPIIGVSWFAAAAYCNALSEKEGLPENEWCYRKNDQGKYAEGMRIKADAGKLKGYRIPTEAEWEYACRAGALTSRYYGNSKSLLDHYAWYLANSGDPSQPRDCARTLPNDLGLFDMLGNVYEWCQDRYGSEPDRKEANLDAIIDASPRLLRGGSFSNQPAFVRSAFRSGVAPSVRFYNDGFRPSRTYN